MWIEKNVLVIDMEHAVFFVCRSLFDAVHSRDLASFDSKLQKCYIKDDTYQSDRVMFTVMFLFRYVRVTYMCIDQTIMCQLINGWPDNHAKSKCCNKTYVQCPLDFNQHKLHCTELPVFLENLFPQLWGTICLTIVNYTIRKLGHD